MKVYVGIVDGSFDIILASIRSNRFLESVERESQSVESSRQSQSSASNGPSVVADHSSFILTWMHHEPSTPIANY
jgi:hypothetical protein